MNRAESARLLVLVCAVWGLSFPATDFALHYFDPFFILVGRFLIATVLLGAALLYTGKFHFTKNELKAGLITGSVFFVCVLTQIIGQLTVNPSSSAFITSLFVIFVPLLLALQHRRVPSGQVVVCALVAFFGMGLLSGATVSITGGEWLTLLSALFWAVHVILISHYGKIDSLRLVFLEMSAVLWLCILAFPFAGHMPSTWPLEPLLAIAFLGIFVGALGYVGQTFAQKQLPAAQASSILLMQAVFAAFFGALLFGVVLSPVQWVGAGLIFAGMWGAQKFG